jgi:hypothetical protein
VPPTVSPTAAPSPAQAPAQAAEHGLVFGRPLPVGANFTAVLVTNASDLTRTFVVEATYWRGPDRLITARGQVNDLPPGGRRVAGLVAPGPLPRDADQVRVGVTAMLLAAPTSSGAALAARIRFGPPMARAPEGAGPLTIEVAVANDDVATRVFTVQAALLRDGDLVGMALRLVGPLPPGEATLARLAVLAPEIPPHDEVVVGITSFRADGPPPGDPGHPTPTDRL